MVKCPRHNSQPNNTNHIMLPTRPKAPKLPESTSDPKGHRTRFDILKHCLPNGINTIVIHSNIPAKNQQIELISPPKTIHIKLPRNFNMSSPFQVCSESTISV